MTASAGSEITLGLPGIVVPPLVRLLIRGITATVRIRVEGIHLLDAIGSDDPRVIMAFFHGRQFLLLGFMAGRKFGIMSSLSRDGELQARTLRGLGYGLVRGSASRSGARGLIGMKKLMEQGYHASFAVDGPRGPLHEVKPGAVYLAKKTGSKILTIASSARPAHIFRKSWDRYLLPWPFSRGAVVLGGPVVLDGDMSKQAIERDSRVLKEEILRVQARADETAGLTGG